MIEKMRTKTGCFRQVKVRIILQIVICLAIFNLAYGASNEDLKYKWQECPVVKCFLLKPIDWQFKVLSTDIPIRFEIYKAHAAKGVTQPKLKIKVLKDAERHTGIKLDRQLDNFVNDLQDHFDVINTWNRDEKIFSSAAIMSTYTLPSDETVKRFNLMVINKITGTLYTMQLESEYSLWDSVWSDMEKTFTQLRLDNQM